MPDIPSRSGDAFDPDDESRREDDSEPRQDSESAAPKPESQPEGIGEAPRHYPAAELLSGMSANAILERIMNGDPLGIRERCSQRIRNRCFLLAFDRLYLRTMARIAHAGVRYRGQVPFDQWINDRIDGSADEIIEEELEAERSGIPPAEPWESHYLFVSGMLGIEPGMTRRGCIRFNTLELPVRRIFFALCVDGITFNRYVAEGNGPPERAKNLLRQAYRALSFPDEEKEYGPPDIFDDNPGELP